MERGSAQFEWHHRKHDPARTPIVNELLFTLIAIQGQPFIHVAIRDISLRKQLAEQLIQAQKMEAVGRLAGGVAHDFNNQLFVILNIAELLQRRLGPDDPSRRELDLILAAARRSSELTRQLLSFSRKQVVQPRVTLVNDVLGDLQKMLGRIIGEDIRLDLQLAPDLDLIRVDPGLLEQAIVNLAVTARDPAVKVIYISGYSENVISHHGVLDPGVNYIQKPFNYKLLLTKVREVIDKT